MVLNEKHLASLWPTALTAWSDKQHIFYSQVLETGQVSKIIFPFVVTGMKIRTYVINSYNGNVEHNLKFFI